MIFKSNILISHIYIYVLLCMPCLSIILFKLPLNCLSLLLFVFNKLLPHGRAFDMEYWAERFRRFCRKKGGNSIVKSMRTLCVIIYQLLWQRRRLHYTFFFFCSNGIWHGMHTKKKTMIYFVYSKSPFGYLLSIIYGSHLFFQPQNTPSFALYPRSPVEAKDIKYWNMNQIFDCLLSIQKKFDMQNRSNVHFHAFLIICLKVGLI